MQEKRLAGVAIRAPLTDAGAMSSPKTDFSRCRVLIVEDVLPLAIQYRTMAKALGVETVTAASVREARNQIGQGPWHAALVDIHLPDGSGFEVMEALVTRWPHCAVIVVSGEDSLDNAVRAAHAGAMDFIEKPVEPDRLQITLRNALQAATLSARVEQLEPVQRSQFHGFIGSSAPMRAVYSMLETVAQSRAPVFIRGESGTGKELAADAVHRCSNRAKGAFVALNCAAIPKELIESELFGHVKGAFTGATADRSGAFLEADGGTLFLDEIAELDINVQAKLLRALQTGEVRRLGETRHRTVDVRIVSATHRDLHAQVQAGRFREDLFYRLYVIPVDLPPLRERGDDVVDIAQAMLERYSREDHKGFTRFSEAARAALLAHPWPGNVRELINVVRAAVALHDDTVMQVEMLPLHYRDSHEAPAAPAASGTPHRAPTAAETPAPAASEDAVAAIRPLATVERETIEQALRLCGGNITRAARALQVNPSTIHRKLASWS
jgi:two-component system repressor protein LuxO